MLPYQRPELPLAQRVDDLLGRMTLAEKIGQLNQRLYGWESYELAADQFSLTPKFTEEATRFGGIGALYGLFRADPWSGVDFGNGIRANAAADAVASVQTWLRDNTRLGIPALIVEEAPHGHQGLDSVLFPVNLNVGATWNPELYAEAAAYVGAELRSRGVHIGLVSALDIARDPRWGRTEECFGEDPYLAARLTEALVRGMQGSGVGVVLKHFAGQGAGVGGRNGAPAPIGERELSEIHLPAAYAGVRAGAVGVMAAYNDIDGVPCIANHPLLTGILRDRWNFDGLVMSDGKAIDRLVRLTGSLPGAAALALRSGVDLSLWDNAFALLDEAVNTGMVDGRDIDTAVRRVLSVKFRLGLFDARDSAAAVEPAIGERLSRAVAAESLVLLHNPDQVLPLSPEIRRIAVIGPNADRLANQCGDYTPPLAEGVGSTVLAGLRELAGPDVTVDYAPGCTVTGTSTTGFAEAVRVAAAAEVAILVLGGSSARQQETVFADNGAAVLTERVNEMNCGEGVDLADVRLGGVQRELVAAVAATGTPVVAVLIQGRPHAVSELPESCAAVVSAWYPGPYGGDAIASVLFGLAEPTGRLPVSVPRSSAQLPVYYNGRDVDGNDYADSPAAARYPFGFGLGYTTFAYAEPDITAGRARVRVTNTGERRGTEVVQCYLRENTAEIWPRRRELCGFTRITLDPGESAEVSFVLPDSDLTVFFSS